MRSGGDSTRESKGATPTYEDPTPHLLPKNPGNKRLRNSILVMVDIEIGGGEGKEGRERRDRGREKWRRRRGYRGRKR